MLRRPRSLRIFYDCGVVPSLYPLILTTNNNASGLALFDGAASAPAMPVFESLENFALAFSASYIFALFLL
jgi:hypothetical protein